MIADTDGIYPGIDADYAHDGRLVALDIRSVSARTPCNCTDQPLVVNWHCSTTDPQRLVILLGLWDVDTTITNCVNTDDPNITLGMDAAQKLCAIFISNPTCSTFSQRPKLAHKLDESRS